MPEQTEFSHARFLRAAALSRLIAQVVAWINFVFLVLALVGQVWPRVLLLTISEFGFIVCIYYSHASRFNLKIPWLLLAASWCTVMNAILTNGAEVGHVIMSWFAILICMAGLLGGARFGLYWAVISCSSVVGIIVCKFLGVDFPNFTPETQRDALTLLHTFAQIVCIACLVVAYSRTQSIYQCQVEEQIGMVKKEVQQRKKAEYQAQIIARNKEQFLRNISHEFRTPLNSIIGFSERLLKKCDEFPGFIKPLEAINRNGKSLHYCINELLLLDAIEATPLQLAHASLVELVKGTCHSCRELALKHHLILQLNIDDDCLGYFVNVDIARMTQALNNILLFCVRQSSSGNIRVSVSRSNESFIIEFTDNAPSLTLVQCENLFETHYEYVLLNDKDIPCSAFALKIASLIMNYHQWGVSVVRADDAGDQGNRFIVTAPLNAAFKKIAPPLNKRFF